MQGSDSKDDDDEAPMSYKALLSRSRKEGRIVPESDKDDVFDVDDEVSLYIFLIWKLQLIFLEGTRCSNKHG